MIRLTRLSKKSVAVQGGQPTSKPRPAAGRFLSGIVKDFRPYAAPLALRPGRCGVVGGLGATLQHYGKWPGRAPRVPSTATPTSHRITTDAFPAGAIVRTTAIW